MDTKRAVIYARFSSSRQREESIEGQVRECKAFAEITLTPFFFRTCLYIALS